MRLFILLLIKLILPKKVLFKFFLQ